MPIPFRQFIAALKNRKGPKSRTLFPERPPIQAVQKAGELRVFLMAGPRQIGMLSYDTTYGKRKDVITELGLSLQHNPPEKLLDVIAAMHTDSTGKIFLQHIHYFEIYLKYRKENITHEALGRALGKMRGGKPSIMVFDIMPQDKGISTDTLVRFYRQSGFDVIKGDYGNWFGYKVFE